MAQKENERKIVKCFKINTSSQRKTTKLYYTTVMHIIWSLETERKVDREGMKETKKNEPPGIILFSV